MLLYGTVVVFAYDMEAVNAGEAGDAIKEIFEDYWDTSLGPMGVLMNEITSLTVGGSSVSPLSGRDVHADHHWRGVAGHPHSGPGVVDGYSTVRGRRDSVGVVHQSHTRAASRPGKRSAPASSPCALERSSMMALPGSPVWGTYQLTRPNHELSVSLKFSWCPRSQLGQTHESTQTSRRTALSPRCRTQLEVGQLHSIQMVIGHRIKREETVGAVRFAALHPRPS